MHTQWRPSAGREVLTTLPCRQCGVHLHAVKTWRRVILRCGQCHTTFAIEEYASQMDDALERFLENVYCNRV